MTDVNYAYNLVLLAKAPTQAESLLYSLEKTAGGTGLYIKAKKQSSRVLNKKESFPN